MHTTFQIKQSGFTFIELIIYLSLIGLVVGGFVSFGLSIAGSRGKTFVTQEVHANARFALDLMTERIQAADGVNIGSSTFGSDPGVLSLSMSTPSQNPTIFSLTVDGGMLQMTEGVGAPQMLTSDDVRVTDLTFTDLTGSGQRENIGISMTIEYGAVGPDSQELTASQTLETSASIRR